MLQRDPKALPSYKQTTMIVSIITIVKLLQLCIISHAPRKITF